MGREHIGKALMMQTEAIIQLGKSDGGIGRIVAAAFEEADTAGQTQPRMDCQYLLRPVDAVVVHRHIADKGGIITPGRVAQVG